MPRPPRPALLLFLFLSLPGQAIAHERWVRHELLSDFDRTLFETANPINLGTLLGVAILGLLLLALSVRTRRQAPTDPGRPTALSDWGATVLGTLAGFGLLLPAVEGQFIAPDLVVDSSPLGMLLTWGGGLVGGLFLLGLWARAAAGLLIGLYCLALFALPFEPFDGESVPALAILNYLDVIGIALFVGIVGRGAFSIDGLISKRPRSSPAQWTKAVGILRISLGLTLALLGAQKFFLPELPMGVVQNYQDQIYEPIARVTGMSPEGYVFCASMVEFTVGVLLLIGVYTRLWTVIVAGLFVVTAIIFRSELIGHLPLVGLAVVLLIEGAGGWRLDDLLKRRLPKGGAGMPIAPAAGLILLTCLFGVLPGCLPTPVEAKTPQWTASAEAFSVVGDGGRYRFEITRQAEPLALNQFFSVQTRVFDLQSAAPVSSGTLQLNAEMPHHGHGMASQPLTVGPDEERWTTNGCKLHMYGRWVFHVEIESGAQEDQASFEFEFSAPARGGVR